MLFSLMVLLILGIVAYFHFIQGFFSATLSAILAIVSAVVAVAFHEAVIVSLLQGKMAELAHSSVLVALFALTYSLLRVLFDSVVPGNVQVPLMVDKIGAGVMGVVAGVFAAGIFAIAAQALPFGPAVGGFARYDLAPDQLISFTIPGVPSRSIDGVISESLKDEKVDPGHRKSLLIPVDKIVLDTTARLSAGGSLAGAVPMPSVHPDYLDELFFQKLGVQLGGKRVAYNLPSGMQVQLVGLYSLPSLKQADSENPNIKYPGRWSQPIPTDIKSDAANILLIARLSFALDAADADGNVRFSPYAVRLVAAGKNNFPLGTLDHGSSPFLRVNRPDDFLFVPGGGMVDLVYYIPAEDVGVFVDSRPPDLKVADGVFIEAKRLGGVDLSNIEVKRDDPGFPAQASLHRKSDMPLPKGITPRVPTIAGGSAQPGAPAPVAGPLESIQSKISSEFVSVINVGRFQGDVESHTFNGGTAGIKEGKFSKLELNPGPALSALAAGEFPIREMHVPLDHKLVQISGIVPAGEGSDPWAWASALGQFQLVDSNGSPFTPNGAWAKVKQGTTDTIVARYNADEPVASVPKSDARPTDVWIVFVVPSGTTLQELKFGNNRVASVNLVVQ